MEKILTFLVNDKNQILLLHNYPDPKHGGDIWYTVTGSKESLDVSLNETVIREVYEETSLLVRNTVYQNVILKYSDINEYVYISYVDDKTICLNEEWIDYKWVDLDEFIDQCHWYYDKNTLCNILTYIGNKKKFYEKEIVLK